MSYGSITRKADYFLNKIRLSESRVADILQSLNGTQSRKHSHLHSLRPTSQTELSFIKEYIKRKLQKHINSTRIKSKNSASKSFNILKKMKDRSHSLEQINKGVQTDFLRPEMKYPKKSEDISTTDDSAKRKTSLPPLNSKRIKKSLSRTHSRPKNPSEFMKDYYRNHVKVNFSPKTMRKKSLTPSKKQLKDFKKVQLFNIIE